MTPEKKFENQIKGYLDSIGAWFIKYWAGSQFTKSGIPDLLCCVNGYFVAIEVKADNGKPTPLQLHNIRKIRESGGFAFVVYPSGFNELKEILADLKLGYFSNDLKEVLR